MKLNKIERGITRYQIAFTPQETKILRAHEHWRSVISVKASQHNRGPLWGQAMLTKTQINEVCDVLGVNGREWLASAGVVA